MVVLCELKDSFGQFFGVSRGIVLKIKLDFFDGLGEHEVVLGNFDFFSVEVGDELLVYLDDLFEVQLFEVDVHPPNEEVDQIALLQFVIPHAAECLQHLGQLPIEVIEGDYPRHALAVLEHEVHAAGH